MHYDLQVIQEPAILHTTLARLVSPHMISGGTADGGSHLMGLPLVSMLRGAATQMTQRLCGIETVMDQLWYVQEATKLALGLGLRSNFTIHPVPMKTC
jgi:hypothetical protein